MRWQTIVLISGLFAISAGAIAADNARNPLGIDYAVTGGDKWVDRVVKRSTAQEPTVATAAGLMLGLREHRGEVTGLAAGQRLGSLHISTAVNSAEHGEGVLAEFETGYAHSVSEHVGLSLYLDTQWADQDYLDARRETDVRPIWSLRSVGVQLGACFELSNRSSLQAVGGYRQSFTEGSPQTLGDAPDYDVVAGVNLSYRFSGLSASAAAQPVRSTSGCSFPEL